MGVFAPAPEPLPALVAICSSRLPSPPAAPPLSPRTEPCGSLGRGWVPVAFIDGGCVERPMTLPMPLAAATPNATLASVPTRTHVMLLWRHIRVESADRTGSELCRLFSHGAGQCAVKLLLLFSRKRGLESISPGTSLPRRNSTAGEHIHFPIRRCPACGSLLEARGASTVEPQIIAPSFGS